MRSVCLGVRQTAEWFVGHVSLHHWEMTNPTSFRLKATQEESDQSLIAAPSGLNMNGIFWRHLVA